MDRLEWFEQLAATARRETPPELNVADQVLRRLSMEPEPQPARHPLRLVAGIGLALSAVAMAMTVPSLMLLSDPLVQLFVPLTMGLP